MKIIVADDSEMMRKIISKELASLDYEVVEAESGKDAIDKLLLNDDVALMTLDWEMPGMSGFETLKKIRYENFSDSFNNDVPVIFVTGNDNLSDRLKGFEVGATEFIVKSAIKEELTLKVRRILEPDNEFKGTHALVVDDSKLSQKVIKNLLVSKGVKVTVADDGKEASRLIRDNIDKIDFVITDLVMKRMDGYELCKYIRRNLGLTSIPIIVLSAVSERSMLIDLFKVGITDYLMKPFIKEEFLARVKIHLQQIEDNKMIKKNYKEKQEAYQKLRDTQEELLKLERKTTGLAMAVTANHEINQPLMVIRGNIELLVENFRDDLTDKQKKKVDKIFESISRIEKILKQFRDLEEVDFSEYSDNTNMINLQKLKEEQD